MKREARMGGIFNPWGFVPKGGRRMGRASGVVGQPVRAQAPDKAGWRASSSWVPDSERSPVGHGL